MKSSNQDDIDTFILNKLICNIYHKFKFLLDLMLFKINTHFKYHIYIYIYILMEMMLLFIKIMLFLIKGTR